MDKDAWRAATVWVEFEASNGIVQKDGLSEGYNICSTKSVRQPVAQVYESIKSALSDNKQAELIQDRESKDL